MKTDTQLQHDVLAQLEWEPSIEAAQVGVTAKDGVVTLTGVVSSYYERIKAEDGAKRVRGVQGVANDIEVKIPGESQLTDADIAAAAIQALASTSAVPSGRLKVTVSKGWVTLEGTLAWQFQRESAEGCVRNLRGVRGITMRVALTPVAEAPEVKHRIESALKRSAELDAQRVNVSSHNGKIVLTGTVHSWNEREEAQQAAWSAPGTTEVDNRLVVIP